ESELRFKELLLVSDYATAIYRGRDLIIEFANDQMIRSWGKNSSVIGKKLEDAIPELAGQPFVQILIDIFETGKPYIAKEDEVHLDVDGKLQTFYFNCSDKPLRDASGSIYAIMNVAAVVTELVNAREKARANENEYRTLAEAMPQMVWTAVPSGKIDYCNRHMCEMLDCTAEELAINDFTDIIHPSDFRLMKALWKEATEKKESFEHEYRMRDHRTGQY